MKYFIIAGERSGDLHAGNLAHALRRIEPDAVMRGFGGEYMKGAGVDLAVHYKDIAVMGFWEVITSLRKISRYLELCKKEIVAFQPDVIILVDFGGFNKRIAAWAHQRSIKVFYYISPKVWAWNQKRALKLKATVDRMFVILPFEKTFYRKFDWDVDYVGNPVLDAIKSHTRDDQFLERNNIPSGIPLVALLPGSRKQEVEKVASVMADVVNSFPHVTFAVATVSNLNEEIYSVLKGQNVVLVQEDTYNLLSHSTAAVVTSGTATLETALLDVPQVVVYYTSILSYHIAKNLIRVPYISLVNLIADKPVVRELIQNDLTKENLVNELTALLSGPRRMEMKSEYEKIYKTLDIGSASENAARKMVGYLKA